MNEKDNFKVSEIRDIDRSVFSEGTRFKGSGQYTMFSNSNNEETRQLSYTRVSFYTLYIS